ncbi:hypothetical protein T439DRAFT_64816 [Meredithblackwellia eburnea MCA 4105]
MTRHGNGPTNRDRDPDSKWPYHPYARKPLQRPTILGPAPPADSTHNPDVNHLGTLPLRQRGGATMHPSESGSMGAPDGPKRSAAHFQAGVFGVLQHIAKSFQHVPIENSHPLSFSISMSGPLNEDRARNLCADQPLGSLAKFSSGGHEHVPTPWGALAFMALVAVPDTLEFSFKDLKFLQTVTPQSNITFLQLDKVTIAEGATVSLARLQVLNVLVCDASFDTFKRITPPEISNLLELHLNIRNATSPDAEDFKHRLRLWVPAHHQDCKLVKLSLLTNVDQHLEMVVADTYLKFRKTLKYLHTMLPQAPNTSHFDPPTFGDLLEHVVLDAPEGFSFPDLQQRWIERLGLKLSRGTEIVFRVLSGQAEKFEEDCFRWSLKMKWSSQIANSNLGSS